MIDHHHYGGDFNQRSYKAKNPLAAGRLTRGEKRVEYMNNRPRESKKQAQNDVTGQNGPLTQIQVLTRGNPTRGLRGSGDSETQRDLRILEDHEESTKKTHLRTLRGLRKEESEDKEQVPLREPEDQRDNEDPDKISVDLPLEEYTKRVYRSHPTNLSNYDPDEQWKSNTWEFTRFMKRHPNLRDLTGSQAANIIPWHVTDFDEDEQFQIVNEWDEVRYVTGEGPLNKALLLAVDHPVPRKSNLARRFNRYAEFLSFAGWLQVVRGEEPIYLPQHKIAGVFGCDRSMIRNLIHAAITEGYLTIVKSHTPRAATRFKFDLDKVPGHFRSGKT